MDRRRARELVDFVVHLRLHYQLFILSGAYLFATVYQATPPPARFWEQFVNVHVLLFGGATAFNSYWDKDEGPIGGLRAPPKMVPWMRTASLGLQAVGLAWATSAGAAFFGLYAVSALLFWLYSTPVARWKGHPIKSLIAIGVSTGTNAFLLGTLASGRTVRVSTAVASIGVACVLLSLYPLSQVYQVEEDVRRGDRTFAAAFGMTAVRRFFVASYALGLGLAAGALMGVRPAVGGAFAAAGTVIGVALYVMQRGFCGERAEYGRVMTIKYATSLAFVLFILVHWVVFF